MVLSSSSLSPECHILLLASNKDSWTFMCEHKSFSVFTRANRPWFIAHILQQNKPCCLQTDELNTTVHSSFNSCLTLPYKLIYKCSDKVHFFHNYKQHTKVSWQKSEADGRLAYQSICIQIIWSIVWNMSSYIVLYTQGMQELLLLYTITYSWFITPITWKASSLFCPSLTVYTAVLALFILMSRQNIVLWIHSSHLLFESITVIEILIICSLYAT